jgi:hypothetical protein
MSELSPEEPSTATAGADPGRRKAAAHEAHGTQILAVTSAAAATAMGETVAKPAVAAYPPPLVPSEVDLRDFRFMPLDVVQLQNSTALRISTTC